MNSRWWIIVDDAGNAAKSCGKVLMYLFEREAREVCERWNYACAHRGPPLMGVRHPTSEEAKFLSLSHGRSIRKEGLW